MKFILQKYLWQMVDAVSSFLADFFGDSTDSLTRVDEDFTPNNSESFLHTSSKVLGQVLCSTLQNAVNSTSYIKHQRSLKSSLPFLYNQTIRKIDSRGSVYDVEASLMKCLWTVYSLDDARNMKSLVQGFYDTFALLAVKYEFLSATPTTEKRIQDLESSRASAGGHSLSSEQCRLLKLYFFLIDYLEAAEQESKSIDTSSQQPHDEAEVHDNLVMKVLLHSILAFIVDKKADVDFYMPILQISTQLVVDTCLAVYATAPTDVQALSTYGSGIGADADSEYGHGHEDYGNELFGSSNDAHSSFSTSSSSARIKHALLNSLLQLQTVINILKYLAVADHHANEHHTKSKQTPHSSHHHHHHSKSSGNQLTSGPAIGVHSLQATEINSHVHWWFSHLATLLIPYQPITALAIKMIVLLVSSSCRFDITTAVLKSSVTNTSQWSSRVAHPELMELLEMNFLNISRAEAIQFLSASPVGTFLIRPHDSNPELYYLSFHSGETEAVKHAIIRKELISVATSGDSSSSDVPSTTLSASASSQSNIATIKPSLDKSVSVRAAAEENEETESGSGSGSGVNSASGSPRDTVVNKMVYKCGKVGPCDTIRDLISSIGKVLPCGLIMTRIPDAELQKLGIKAAAIDTSAFQSSVNSNSVDFSLNANADMWNAVFDIFKRFRQQKYTHADGLARLNTMLLTAVDRAEELENEHVYQFFESLLAALTLKELGRFLADANISFTELISTMESRLGHFEMNAARLYQLNGQLASSTIKKLASISTIRKSRFHKVPSDINRSDQRQIKASNFKNFSAPLSITEEAIINGLEPKSNQDSEVMKSTMVKAYSYIYGSATDFIQALTTISGSSLTHQLLKSNHSLLSHHDDDSMSLPTICAEALAVQIFKVLPNNYVRFPGKGCGTFTEHRICCVESNELISHLAKTINQYNSKVSTSILASINASSQSTQSQSHVITSETSIRGFSDTNSNTSDPTRPAISNSTAVHEGLNASPSRGNVKGPKRGLRKALSTTFDEKFKKAHTFIESVVHRVSTTGNLHTLDHKESTDSSANAVGKLEPSSSGIFSSAKERKPEEEQRDTQLLLQLLLASTPFVRQLFYPRSANATSTHAGDKDDQADDHDGYQLETVQDITLLSPAEYLTWLMETSTLQSITKSPDNAFEGAKLYYRYRDPWESHVPDPNSHTSASDYIRYGRNRFKAVTSNCGGNVLVPMIKTFKRYRERALSLAEQVLRRPSVALTPPKSLGKDLDDDEEEEFKRQLVSLWETLKAESWLVTAISSTSAEESTNADSASLSASQPPLLSRVPSTGTEYTESEPSPPRRHLFSASDGIWRSTNGSGDETYLSCLSRHMFRNALFHRLGLPHRFTVSVQVDIFGLKEVGSKDGFSFVHMTSGIELYGILRLGRKKKPNLSHINLVKAPIDGSTVTKPAHAELLKLPGGSHGTEYTWRERTKFKFSFPEELHAHSIHNVKGWDETSQQSGDVWTTNILDPPQMLFLSVYEKTFFADTKLGELSLPMSQLTINRPFRDWVALSGDPSASSTWFVHLQMQLKLPLKVIEQTAPTQEQHLLVNKLRSNAPVGTSAPPSTATIGTSSHSGRADNGHGNGNGAGKSLNRPAGDAVSSRGGDAKGAPAGFLRQMEDSF